MNVNKAGRNSKLHYLLSGMSRGSPAAKSVSRVCCRSRGNKYISQPDGIKDKLISTRKLTLPKTGTRKQIPEESESSRVILTTQPTDWCIKINMVASTYALLRGHVPFPYFFNFNFYTEKNTDISAKTKLSIAVQVERTDHSFETLVKNNRLVECQRHLCVFTFQISLFDPCEFLVIVMV